MCLLCLPSCHLNRATLYYSISHASFSFPRRHSFELALALASPFHTFPDHFRFLLLASFRFPWLIAIPFHFDPFPPPLHKLLFPSLKCHMGLFSASLCILRAFSLSSAYIGLEFSHFSSVHTRVRACVRVITRRDSKRIKHWRLRVRDAE